MFRERIHVTYVGAHETAMHIYDSMYLCIRAFPRTDIRKHPKTFNRLLYRTKSM